MKPEDLLELLKEVEREDPIDFTGLPFEAADLRQLACLNVADLMNNWLPNTEQEDQNLIMAATIARLVLENMVLQIRISVLTRDDFTAE